MVKFAVSGALGRMGRRIISLGMEDKDLKLVGALERKGHPSLGNDIGLLLGTDKCEINLTDNPEEAFSDAHVVVDFTSPSSTLLNLEKVSDMGKSMVIGTTGFSNDEKTKLMELAKRIPCVIAPNMSIGVNLLLKVLRIVASVLKDDYDIEIIEAHHRLKKDAPSGTALRMAEVIAESIGRDLRNVAVYLRKGVIGERTNNEIGIQCIRGGDVVGEHTVMFLGMGERVEITHRASNRDTFARGTLRAIKWIYDKPAGVYDMQDVLGIKG